tara:strand:+ start:1678 stop:1890 length:213 start_codon:yes stop_codon:yes gene_type:complete
MKYEWRRPYSSYLSEWLKDNNLVALRGTDLELIKDYIDKKCIIIIPKEYYKSASFDMGSSHIEEAHGRKK